MLRACAVAQSTVSKANSFAEMDGVSAGHLLAAVILAATYYVAGEDYRHRQHRYMHHIES